MQNAAELRKQWIEKVVLQHPALVDVAATQLWEALAIRLVALIGEGGFLALYRRSVYITRSRFAWLALPAPQAGRQQIFSALCSDLHTQLQSPQGSEQAPTASVALFHNFSDILAGLIGEAMTLDLLQAAWSVESALEKAFQGDMR